ncbi:hypothetical protein [Ectopseudomonas alcaliphila]|uniref:hypothetical protein n=1 Tax=Ectopseudomonas alcaliphila TaxID=101564 RepID=UPI002786D77E|nr:MULTISPECIES: hypothetical protein [Pseudomonas]MDP9941331.1 hypothetical protein [Pseudomonas sp. 3400]MDR7013550.1 hypothetical protein [Pseudomonas alcaliphila]
MRSLICKLLLALGLFGSQQSQATTSLNYDSLILLDAEALAEQGISEAYERLLPHLKKYVKSPIKIEEQFSSEIGRYSVKAGGEAYEIYGPGIEGNEAESWGRATHAFFHIINKQIVSGDIRFYAVNNGNDLGGIFLSQSAVEQSKVALKNRQDWPYLPEPTPPWYGQHH